MRRVLVICGVLMAVTVAEAMAEYAGYPQRVYRGRTYLILEPRPTVSMWYAGDGYIRSGAERITTFRRTTTKRYSPEK